MDMGKGKVGTGVRSQRIEKSLFALQCPIRGEPPGSVCGPICGIISAFFLKGAEKKHENLREVGFSAVFKPKTSQIRAKSVNITLFCYK
jgi:hypothetical protein